VLCDTINGHTQYLYSSAMSWVHGKHAVKFGGEQRPFFNNSISQTMPLGCLTQPSITTEDPFQEGDPQTGSVLPAMLLGFPRADN